MKTPPLLADFSHIRVCKPFCEKSLTLPSPSLTVYNYYTVCGTTDVYFCNADADDISPTPLGLRRGGAWWQPLRPLSSQKTGTQAADLYPGFVLLLCQNDRAVLNGLYRDQRFHTDSHAAQHTAPVPHSFFDGHANPDRFRSSFGDQLQQPQNRLAVG